MTYDRFRSQFEEYWGKVSREAKRQRDSQSALEELNKFYRRLDEQEKEWANRILMEWVLSEDPTKRFDALALIDRNEIIEALPTLRIYMEKLETRTDHEVPFERKKVQRIMERLITSSTLGQA